MNHESRALTGLAENLDLPFVLADHTVDDGESEAEGSAAG